MSRLISQFGERTSSSSSAIPQNGAQTTTKGILKNANYEPALELRFDSPRLQALSVKAKTITNTIFNQKQFRDVANATLIPSAGILVLVSGLAQGSTDLCTVLCVKRSTVHVILMRTPLPLENNTFSVDFDRISLVPEMSQRNSHLLKHQTPQTRHCIVFGNKMNNKFPYTFLEFDRMSGATSHFRAICLCPFMFWKREVQEGKL